MPEIPQAPRGRPQGGLRSEEGRAAYWRMQWESAIGALADLIAEHTETVEELGRLRAEMTPQPAQSDTPGVDNLTSGPI